MIDNAQQPEQAAEFGLDPDNVMDYDFEDAKNNIKTYVEEVMNALGARPTTVSRLSNVRSRNFQGGWRDAAILLNRI